MYVDIERGYVQDAVERHVKQVIHRVKHAQRTDRIEQCGLLRTPTQGRRRDDNLHEVRDE